MLFHSIKFYVKEGHMTMKYKKIIKILNIIVTLPFSYEKKKNHISQTFKQCIKVKVEKLESLSDAKYACNVNSMRDLRIKA